MWLTYTTALLAAMNGGRPHAPTAGKLYKPMDMVVAALADVRMLPVELRKHTRYLTVYNFPQAERLKWWQTVSFVANSLSRERVITPPYVVPGTDGALLRLNLDDYQWSAETYYDLAAKGSGPNPKPDPYFHSLATVGGKTVFGSAPWIALDGGKAVASLIQETVSQAPILRADWFVANVTLPPFYYEFLGLDPVNGTEEDFQKLAFATPDLVAKARLETKGVVVKSRVALHNRTLTRLPTIAGYYWESHDTKKGTDDRNYMSVLLDEKFDAKEIIARGLNGLQLYAVVDAAGKLQDKADPDIAQDYETSLQDKQVRTGRNCMSCHSAGMQEIADRVRHLSSGQISLLVADPKQARRIKDLFFASDIAPTVQLDSLAYEQAVKSCNGLKPDENASQFQSFVHGYTDALVTEVDAARECGLDVQTFRVLLSRAVGVSSVLTSFLQKKPFPAVREQWEEVFGQMMSLTYQKL